VSSLRRRCRWRSVHTSE